MGVYPSKNKMVSIQEAVALIQDGNMVAVGGNLSAREPMALIREMIRQGKKNLHTIGGAHGIDIDLMCAGGIVGTVQNSYVGLEGDFGMAANFRHGAEKGGVKVKDTDCVALLMQLRASAFGVPFMPMPAVRGTDILKLNPEIKEMNCPYTGESVNLLPAIRPDVAVIHAHKADPQGNLKIDPPYFADPLIVEASDKVIASVEKIVSTEEMERLGATIPYYEVTALVEIPFGAHPTSCYPDYTYDRRHITEYMEIAGKGFDAFQTQYLRKYVSGP
ncbi:MAG: CoA transferase subunit A, partial [Deltaproteobacteria bacterium]|nr:CoA transferase subunit A [Deltaproteobacteria bacterium]